MTAETIAISWGRKSDQSASNEVVTNRFFSVAVRQPPDQLGLRDVAAERVSNPQMVDGESWAFDKDRDIDGDGHVDTVVTYDVSKSNFIDGTYKGLIILTSAAGAVMRAETHTDESTSNDGEGENGSSIDLEATVNCVATIGGRPAWLLAMTSENTDLNDEAKDRPEWTEFTQTAWVIDAAGMPRQRPVYATIVATAKKKSALGKKLAALSPPKALVGATRLAECGPGDKLALITETDKGFHLLSGFALDKKALGAGDAFQWGETPAPPKAKTTKSAK